MKQYIMGIVTGMVITASVTAFAAQMEVKENPFKILVNGTEKNIAGYNINDNTYFKLRDVADATGNLEVGFENDTILLNTTKEETPVTPTPTPTPTPTKAPNADNYPKDKAVSVPKWTPDNDSYFYKTTSDELEARLFDDGYFYVRKKHIEDKMEEKGLHNYVIVRTELWKGATVILNNIPVDSEEGVCVRADYYEYVLRPFIDQLVAEGK